MGFYIGSDYHTEINLVTPELYQNNGLGITIVNNESIVFSAEDIISSNPKYLFKIHIENGDGSVELKQKPIKGDDKSWLTWSHKYNFKNTAQNKNITITLYSLCGATDVITIPFTILETSIEQQGIDLELVTANIDNSKEISYIFNNKTENQLILAKQQR